MLSLEGPKVQINEYSNELQVHTIKSLGYLRQLC